MTCGQVVAHVRTVQDIQEQIRKGAVPTASMIERLASVIEALLTDKTRGGYR